MFQKIFYIFFFSSTYISAQNSESTFQKFLKIPIDSVRCDSLSNLGRDMEFVDKNLSLQSQKEALKIAQKLGDKKRIGTCLYRLGCEEQVIEQHTEAIKHLQEAYQIFESLHLHQRQIKAVNKIAQVLDEKKDFTSALKYFRLCLALSQKHNYPEYEAYSYISIGAIEGFQYNHFELALDYLKKGGIICQKQGLDLAYHNSLLDKAGVYQKMRQFDKALPLIQDAITYYRNNKTYNGYAEAAALGKMASLLYEKKNLVEAEKNVKASLQLAEKQYQSLDLRVEMTDLLRKIYDAQGKIALAYQTQQQWRVLYDTLTNQNARKTVATLQTQFETAQKESQIKELDDQNHLQKKQLIWAILSLTVLLASLIWSIYLYRKLNQNKLKIEEQSMQLTQLMKELHHRVKNNLAIVSSLLSMQSNRLEDKNAAKAVREGQMRVQAMSLIHQKLYKTDDVSTVNIRDYFTELAESLMQAYGYSPDNFELNVEVDNPNLDVDLAISMGLIVNELITNSFKYAYEGIHNPQLNIHLKNQQNITLEVSDNGIGIDEKTMNKNPNSFGQKLIKGLSKQLKGQYRFEHQNGTYFELIIPKTAA